MASAQTVLSVMPPAEPQLVERMLALVCVPAAIVEMRDGVLHYVAANWAYSDAGIDLVDGASPVRASLAELVETFLPSDSASIRISWTIGDVVDLRYYDLNIARMFTDPAHSCILTFLDRTSEARTEQSLRREMTTDSLTGLPNRQGFGDLIEAVMPIQDSHAVLVVDLDRFGSINACLGSLVGDELLISVARRIKGVLRASDRLSRIGGDEFGILIAIDEHRDEATHLAQRIKGALSTPFRLTDYHTRVDCSVGIAFGDNAVDDAEELIRHAQFAVKRAKASGMTEAYQTQAFDAARARYAIETSLRRGIENGDLTLHYQPICDLGTGRIVAFEALARWQDEHGRMVSPVEFIPVAEESGLIVPLGRWAVAEAMRTLAEWETMSDHSRAITVAVNVSPIQLQRDAMPDVVAAVLAKTGLNGARLKLELTESALIADPDGTARTMHALRDLGCTLAMDDFGTGYSNLASLQKLPIDVLKIDRSFVTGMLVDRDKIAIVRAILSLAQALNMRTVAEGIETHALAQTLSALGCHHGQGFLYSRPLPAEQAYALLVSRNA